MKLEDDYYSLSLVQDSDKISNNITIPVLIPNKLFFMSPLFLTNDPIVLRFTVDSKRYSSLIKQLTPHNLRIVLSINELQGLKLVVKINSVNVVDTIYLNQEVKQLAVDISFTIDNSDLFMFMNQFKSVSALTFSLRIQSDMAIVAMDNKQRYYFDTYHMQGQTIYLRPQITYVNYIEKTNITVIELSRVLPPFIIPSLTITNSITTIKQY